MSYFLGIDIGTQGARVVLIDAAGNLIGSSEEPFVLNERSRIEQLPEEWWEACQLCLMRVTGGVKTMDLRQIKAIAVTSTSGTVIPLDSAHKPLYDAIMYSDPRSAAEAVLCKEAALRWYPGGYSGFNASSGLSKMVWFVRHFPEKAQRLSRWVHAADYITGKLSGRWGVTDYTNALKSGYDVKAGRWPAYLYEQLPLKEAWLPEVVPSGQPIGVLLPSLAAKLGMSDGVQIVAGMTDGCASQIAAGAVNPGDWNTTIGTTLVIKGVTRKEIIDPEGRLYCHRHPEGFWMPGGASNTGADWITKEFNEDLSLLNEQAGKRIPTGHIAWPLCVPGERFPFIAPQARGFAPPGLSVGERYAANLEGVAYLERCAYDLIRQLSGETIKAVYTAGGGSNSDVWLRIRSSVLNLPIYKMKHVTGAVGAGILAASKTHFSSILDAGRAMTQIEKEVLPVAELVGEYAVYYKKFISTLQEKGYIREEYYA